MKKFKVKMMNISKRAKLHERVGAKLLPRYVACKCQIPTFLMFPRKKKKKKGTILEFVMKKHKIPSSNY